MTYKQEPQPDNQEIYLKAFSNKEDASLFCEEKNSLTSYYQYDYEEYTVN